MNTLPRLSLAAGVMADHEAIDLAQAAVASPFKEVGFTVNPSSWSPSTTRAVAATLAGEVSVLDVEVVRIPPGGAVTDEHRFIIETGAQLGAENVLIISSEPDITCTTDAFAQLAEHCGGVGLRACLEFMRFTTVRTLRDALAISRAVGNPAAGILIDTLHLARTDEYELLPSVTAQELPYLQFCDGLLTCGDSNEALIHDALDLRSAPGRGELPLQNVLDGLPAGRPLSLEVRSRALRERYPEPVARATALYTQTVEFFTEKTSD